MSAPLEDAIPAVYDVEPEVDAEEDDDLRLDAVKTLFDGDWGDAGGAMRLRSIPAHVIARYKPTIAAKVAIGRRAAVGYARESSPEQTETSQPRQHDNIRTYAEKSDLAMRSFFCDEGVTGTSTYDRHQFREMMGQARLRAFQVIVFEDVDRLSRSLPDLLACYEELVALGIEVHDCKHGKLDLVHIVVLGLMAAQGRVRFIDLCKGGKRLAAKGGRLMHAPIYAYRRHPKLKGVHVIVPERALVVERIFKLVADGVGSTRIARELSRTEMSPRQCLLVDNGEALPARPLPWSAAEVRSLIRNPLYFGLSIYGKTVPIRDHQTKRITGYDVLPHADWVFAEVPRYAIVTETLAAAAVRSLSERVFGAASAANRAGIHLLSGCAKCAACRSAMHVQSRNGRLAYVCSDHESASPGACPVTTSLRLDLLEPAIIDAVARHVFDAKADAAYRARFATAATHVNRRRARRLKVVDAEIEKIDGALQSQVAQSLLAKVLSERVVQIVKANEERHAELLAEKATLEAAIDPAVVLATLDTLSKALEHLRTKVPFVATEPEGEAVAQLLRRLVGSIYVHERTSAGVARVDLAFNRDCLAGAQGIRAEKIGDRSRALTLHIDVKGAQQEEVAARFASLYAAANAAAALGVHDLSDEAWALVAPLTARLKPGLDGTKVAPRLLLDGILCILKTGGRIFKCPERFGDPGVFSRAVYRLVYSCAWDEIVAMLEVRAPEALASADLAVLQAAYWVRGTPRRRKGRLVRRPAPAKAAAEAAVLRERAKTEPDLPTRRRYATAALHLEGESASVIAEVMAVPIQQVYRTVSDYRYGGAAALASSAVRRAAAGYVTKPKGFKRLIIHEEEVHLAELVRGVRDPVTGELLTYRHVIDHCEKRTGVRFSMQGMRYLLERHDVVLGAIVAPVSTASQVVSYREKQRAGKLTRLQRAAPKDSPKANAAAAALSKALETTPGSESGRAALIRRHEAPAVAQRGVRSRWA